MQQCHLRSMQMGLPEMTLLYVQYLWMRSAHGPCEAREWFPVHVLSVSQL